MKHLPKFLNPTAAAAISASAILLTLSACGGETETSAPQAAAPAVTETAAMPTLLGTWSWTDPATSCEETYTYKEGGKSMVQSGGVLYQDEYTLAEAPMAGGRYRLEVVTVTQSEGSNCMGDDQSYVGMPYTAYVAFSADHKTITLYPGAEGGDGVGPLTLQGAH